ncbi:MAG: hypothetical protein IKO15_04365 [Clostridiales bacterium]|nr:hypothetical protein [Clostridiales bacterium]MBR4556697.1 hypothetical protein [Clostridiales bacterium]
MSYDEEYAEAQRLQAEINYLIDQYNAEVVRQAQLIAELEYLEDNVPILNNNAQEMSKEVNHMVGDLRDHMKKSELDVSDVFYEIDNMVNSYFTYKTMSSASKSISQYTDEYYTKFRFFNKLRRITLGYIIGLDAQFVESENLRKEVEKVYLQNTEYWLAYAAMAVELWASDEKEAADRAIKKAVYMDGFKTSVFFVLVNMRFNRMDAAKKWYLSYLEKVDVDDIGNEWQYMLQAYLMGIFGADPDFNNLVKKNISDLFKQLQTLHPGYGTQVIKKAKSFVETYVYVTETEYETLRRYSPQYEEIKGLLTSAEKNAVIIEYIRQIWEEDELIEEDFGERVEDILYDLISEYDEKELEVWKRIRYNEYIMRARGDVTVAKQKFNNEFPPDGGKSTLADKLFQWAFEQNYGRADMSVRRFALSYLRKWIAIGFEKYAQEYRSKEKKEYRLSIDGWERDCNEDSAAQYAQEIQEFYRKNRVRNMLADKYIDIFLIMCAISAVLIVTTFVMTAKGHFSPIPLVIGILTGAAGGFLLWRRIVNLDQLLEIKMNKTIGIMKLAVDELGKWRKKYKQEDKVNEELVSVFDDLVYEKGIITNE